MTRSSAANCKHKVRGAVTVLVSLSLLGSFAAPGGAYQRPGGTERVSVASDGSEGRRVGDAGGLLVTADSMEASISANGRFVAFTSSADNLVPGDDNQVTDVFVHDRVTAKTELISATSNGIPAVGSPSGSLHPRISSNGRYVAFVSSATNLVPGDSNVVADVFVHDRVRGRTQRVSVSSNRDEANGRSDSPSLSRDGGVIAFQSDATNLTPSNTPGVFVHDLSSGKTEQIAQNGGTPSISGNARYVVFQSDASEPGDGDLNAAGDVFIHDRVKDSLERISVATDGTVGNRFSHPGIAGRSISDDGRYVAFESPASNLVPNDTNTRVIGVDGHDVFVRDRQTHRTERISIGPAGEEVIPMDSVDRESVIDPSGRFVAYSTYGAVSPEDEAGPYPSPDLGLWDAYVFDRATGSPEILSVDSHGRQGASCESDRHRAGTPAIGRHAEFAAFSSCSPDLVSDDGNFAYDIFVRDRGPLLGGSLGGSGAPPPQENGEDEPICVVPGVCIPPGSLVSSQDEVRDVNYALTEQGANLYGASLAHRPRYEDLFAVIELEYMPKVLADPSPIFYGLRFKVENRSYEVRATSLLGGTFGLFDCTGSLISCTKVTDLRGGYGTTGMRVVLSLPLAEIGLENGGKLKDPMAFSGLGTFHSGATKVLDRVTIR